MHLLAIGMLAAQYGFRLNTLEPVYATEVAVAATMCCSIFRQL